MSGEKGDMTKENMFPFLEIPYELRVLEVVLESVCICQHHIIISITSLSQPVVEA